MNAEDNIEQSIKNLCRTTTSDTDERILNDVFTALEETGGLESMADQRRIWGVIIRSKIAKLTVAAVVIAGSFIAYRIITDIGEQQDRTIVTQQNRAKEKTAREAGIAVEPDLEASPEAQKPEERLDAELKNIVRMFIAGDVDGLVATLSQGQLQSKLAAAYCLAQIGDSRAISALEELSAEYGEDDPNNVFAVAVAQIEGRIEVQDEEAIEITGDEMEVDSNEVAKITTVDLGERAISIDSDSTGDVRTQNGRRYIYGWLVDGNGSPVQGEVQIGGGSKSVTGKDGAFSIPEPSYREFTSSFGRAFNANGNLGCFFILHPSNDINEVEITVKPMASISGFVVDENGMAVDDFRLIISPVIKDDLVYKSSIGKLPWQSNIYADGSFEVNSIPTGVGLQLAVNKPGFKTAVKLDNLVAGRNLDLGQITLEPLPWFDEETQWSCSLAGFVIDENNEPMIGSKISAAVAEERLEIITDANGWYEFKGLPQGVQVIITPYFNGYGYNSFSFTCFELENKSDIQMFPPAYDWYGKPAPGVFVDKWLNTEPITLSDLAGNVVLLHLGIDLTRYPGRIKDMDYLRELEQIRDVLKKYVESPLTVIAIHKHLTREQPTEKSIRQFIREYDIQFPFGIDAEMDVVKDMMLPRSRFRSDDVVRVPRKGLRNDGAMYSLYDVKAKPALYLIDKEGVLRTSLTLSNLGEWIERLLAE